MTTENVGMWMTVGMVSTLSLTFMYLFVQGLGIL